VPVLVPGTGDGVRLPPELSAKVGIQTAEVKLRGAARPRVLHLPGSLAIDSEHLSRLRCRWAPAEVVEIGKPEGAAANHELRVGDRVRKGQLLAILRSADVGQKKNELFDARIQLQLDTASLYRAEKVRGDFFLLSARRNVQLDHNAIIRLEHTLLALGISQAEIEAIRKQAQAAGQRKAEKTEERQKRTEQWSLVELRAPDDGTIVERNCAVGEVIPDSTINLFQIARLDRLKVLASVPEVDLPLLEVLKPAQRRWTIRTGVDAPAAQGGFDTVVSLIDPNQHTAQVLGFVDNSEGRLRAGQFITASVTLPVPDGETILPASAVVEEDHQAFVFVQPDPKSSFFEQRRVAVVRRGQDVVHVRSRLSPEEERQGIQTVRPGERVVTAGAVDLKALLSDLKVREGR
jgi:cobalt-zinc-cadmium efflux system membrane fusion protein